MVSPWSIGNIRTVETTCSHVLHVCSWTLYWYTNDMEIKITSHPITLKLLPWGQQRKITFLVYQLATTREPLLCLSHSPRHYCSSSPATLLRMSGSRTLKKTFWYTYTLSFRSMRKHYWWSWAVKSCFHVITCSEEGERSEEWQMEGGWIKQCLDIHSTVNR